MEHLSKQRTRRPVKCIFCLFKHLSPYLQHFVRTYFELWVEKWSCLLCLNLSVCLSPVILGLQKTELFFDSVDALGNCYFKRRSLWGLQIVKVSQNCTFI